MENLMAMASIFGAKAVRTKAISKMDLETVMGYGAKATKMISTKVSSRRTRRKATEFTLGVAEISIKAIIMLI